MSLRAATPQHACAVAEVHLASRRAAPMPPGVHTDDEVLAWLTGRLDADEVWVAEVAGDVVGYVRLTETWLDDLYVAPASAGLGVGSMLLDLAKTRRPDGFGLWVFAMNRPARDFYARRGLVEVLWTDGADNEEKCPDVQLAWRGWAS